jgi:hypothetical protein
MPGNPKECREHAKNCLQMAKEATTDSGRQTFQLLAERWLVLAAELEAAEALIKEWGNGRSQPS